MASIGRSTMGRRHSARGWSPRIRGQAPGAPRSTREQQPESDSGRDPRQPADDERRADPAPANVPQPGGDRRPTDLRGPAVVAVPPPTRRQLPRLPSAGGQHLARDQRVHRDRSPPPAGCHLNEVSSAPNTCIDMQHFVTRNMLGRPRFHVNIPGGACTTRSASTNGSSCTATLASLTGCGYPRSFACMAVDFPRTRSR